MRMPLLHLVVLSALSVLACPAHAEIAIGGFAPAISFFGANAQGEATPSGQISGDLTVLTEPIFGVYEPHERVIYVSDFNGQALRVYPAFARGNVPPLRMLNPPAIGQARANAPVFAHDEIGLIVFNCCIATYPLHANGDAVPALRTIGWGGASGSQTDLDNPTSLRYLPDTDEYVVSEYNRIVFHARTDGHYDPPTRRITGAAVANTISLAHDPASHRLYLLQQAPWDGSSPTRHARIAVFADDANGDAPPLYTIEGPTTGLDLPPEQYMYGIGHDPWLHRLMVSSSPNTGSFTANRLVTFSDTASGDATPLQTLVGTNTGSSYLGTPFAVPADVIFANAFDHP